MRYFSLLIFTLVAATTMVACNTGDSTSTLSKIIQYKIDSLQETEELHGIFVGTVSNAQRQYHTSGFAIPDRKVKFDSSTLFEIGSISKTFTAYVLESVLREKGISDSSSIISFLPDSVQSNRDLESITFYSLLNHSSGLPRLPDNMDLSKNPLAPYDDYDLRALYTYLRTCKPYPTGKSNYSNLGAGLAGVLAQRITGRNYEDLLHRYIFSPFNITQHPDETINATTNKAQGYFSGNKTPYWFADALAPAGGLKSSTNELLSYLQCMYKPVDDSAKAIIDKLLVPTIAVNGKISVCRSWHTYQLENNEVIYWHNGGTYGFSTFAGFSRKRQKAVVIVINHFNKNQFSDQLGFFLLQLLLN